MADIAACSRTPTVRDAPPHFAIASRRPQGAIQILEFFDRVGFMRRQCATNMFCGAPIHGVRRRTQDPRRRVRDRCLPCRRESFPLGERSG